MTEDDRRVWVAEEVEQATQSTAALLDELGLAAYLFAIEPHAGGWELKVECAVDEGWEAIVLPVDVQLLLASRSDPSARAQLIQAWGPKLAACRRASDAPP